jgi:hypothetical protein
VKALTLQRPWAAAFLLPTDPKRIENRTWKPPANLIGKRLALHSGQGFWPNHERCVDLLTSEIEREYWANLCTITGVFATVTVAGFVVDERPHLFDADREVIRSRWWLGPVAWVLTDFVALPEPIECKGHQGLWNFDYGLLS